MNRLKKRRVIPSGSDHSKSHILPKKSDYNEKNKNDKTIMGYFLFSIDDTNLIKAGERRTETAMNTEYFVLNECRKREKIENFCAVAPDINRTVLSKAFIVEAVHLCDLTGFVVTTNKRNSIWISHFKCEKK